MTASNDSARVNSTSPRGDVLARVEDLHLYFDTKRGVVKALDGVNFDLHEGEILSLVGETGCGKTITGRSFMQLVPTPPGRYPQGRVLVRTDEDCESCDGVGCSECSQTGLRFEDVITMTQTRMRALRGNQISMIFQDPRTTLNPSLTIGDHVAESILAHQGPAVLEAAGIDIAGMDGFSRRIVRRNASTDGTVFDAIVGKFPPLRKHVKAIEAEVREQSVQILRDTQIPNPRDVLDDYPHELSGGQQQRVMIAMALVSKPDLLIADEATTALDVTTQARILELLKDLQEKYGTSVLYITHDLTLVRKIADRVAVMYAGDIAEIGTVDQVYSDPKHPYTRGLLDSIPTSETVDQDLVGIEGTIPDLTNPPAGCRFCTRCPEVLDHCEAADPPTVSLAEDHEVSCHLYGDDTEHVAETPNQTPDVVEATDR